MPRIRLSRRTLVKCGVFLLAAAVFFLCLISVGNTLEIRLLAAVQQMRMPWLDVVMLCFTYLGSVYGIIAVLLLSFIKRDVKGFSFPLIVTVTVSWLLNELIKVIVARPRPPIAVLTESSYSFVSGHTMNNTTLYLMMFLLLVLCLPVKKIWWLLLVPLPIAFSRLYFAVHYPTDVLGGFAASVMLVVVAFSIFRALHLIPDKKQNGPSDLNADNGLKIT